MIELRGVGRSFRCGNETFDALKKINLSLPEKGLCFVVGKSGSGKSTLLGILGGLLSPTSGSYLFEGKDLTLLKPDERQRLLSSKISFVFQDSNLIRDFSVEENVSIAGADEPTLREVIHSVGLTGKTKERAGNLSGGEAQRVAIARAVVKKTKVLLMDEPTGSLDAKNGKRILEMARSLSRDMLVVIVTHDLESAYAYGNEIITLSDGRVVQHEKNEKTPSLNLKVLPDDGAIDSFLRAVADVEKAVIVAESNERKEFALPPLNKKAAILSAFAQNYGTAAAIELKKPDPPSLDFVSHHDGKPRFGLSQRFRYASSMAKRKTGRGIVSAIVLALGLGLISFQASVSRFDEASAMQDAFASEAMTISPLMKRQENENLREVGEYRTGEDFHSEIQSEFGEALPIITGSLPNAISPTVCYILPTSHPMTVFDGKTYSPTANGVFISPFLRDIAANNNRLTITISESAWSSCFDFEILGTYDYEYDPLEMARHQADPSYQYRERDEFRGKHALVLADSDTCKQMLRKCRKISLRGGNPALCDIPSTKTYFDASLDYSCYETEALLRGNAPTKPGEAIISESFAKSCFPLEMTQNPEEIIGKTLKYKNLRESPNWVSYQSCVNFYDVHEELKITGIIDDPKAAIYLYDNDWGDLCRREMCCSTGVAAYASDPKGLGKLICESGFYCDYSFASPIYQLAKLSQSALSYIALGIGIALTFICSAFLSLLCASEIKERSKEIAVIKSLGIKEGSILSSFFVQIGFCVLPAFLASVGLGAATLSGLNSVMKSPEVYGISYSLFSFEPSSVVICLLLCVASIFLSLLMPMWKLKRTDVYDTLKS